MRHQSFQVWVTTGVTDIRTDVLRSLAIRRDAERLFSSLGALVIIPAVFGALGVYNDELKKVFGELGVFAFWAAAVLLLGILAVRLHLPERSVHSLLLENVELSDRCADLTSDIQQLDAAIGLLTLQVNFCEATRATVITHATRGIKDLGSFVKALDDMAAPIYLENEAIFGFGSSKKWSFAVYLYSANEDRLLPVWRRKAANHPSEGNGRAWGRGEGHVGKAFVDRKAIITGNALGPEVAEFSSVPPGQERPYDDTLYVSFASIPIGPVLEEDNRPYGVLVGTSNREGRFDRENTGILVQIAGVIASLLITGDLDIDVMNKQAAQAASQGSAA